MDDDEEDELGLRSPVKIVEAPTVKPTRVGGGVATAKGKAVFGTAKGVNTQGTHEDPEEVDDADDATSSKRTSRQPKTKAVRVGRKPNNTTAHPRVKALAASSKPRKPAAFVDSSDEEVEVEDVDAEEVETTPRSADGVSMPEEQIQHFLHGYDLDGECRCHDRPRGKEIADLRSFPHSRSCQSPGPSAESPHRHPRIRSISDVHSPLPVANGSSLPDPYRLPRAPRVGCQEGSGRRRGCVGG